MNQTDAPIRRWVSLTNNDFKRLVSMLVTLTVAGTYIACTSNGQAASTGPDDPGPDAMLGRGVFVSLDVAAVGATSGAIEVVGATISAQCIDRSCSYELPRGANVRVRAIAPPGATFTSWSGACQGFAAHCVLSIHDTTVVTANFEVAGDPHHSWTLGASVASVAVDSRDQVLVVGVRSPRATASDATPIYHQGVMFAGKYSPDGQRRWSVPLVDGTPGYQDHVAVAVGRSDHVVVMGRSVHEQQQLFLGELDSATGAYRWFRAVKPAHALPTCLAVSENGDIVFGGRFRGSVTFATTTLTAPAEWAGFLVRYAANGSLLTAHVVERQVHACAVDSSGNAIVALESVAGVHVAKYSRAGSLVWRADISGPAHIDDIHSGSDDEVCFVGTHRQPITLLGPPHVDVAASDPNGNLIAGCLESQGKPLWLRSLGGLAEERATAIACHARGSIAVVGYFRLGDLNLGGGQVPVHGREDGFVASYRISDGAYRWSRTFGDVGSQVDRAHALALTADGKAIVGGALEGHSDLGTGVLGSGGAVGFVATYGP